MNPDLIAPCGMNCALCISHFGFIMSGEKRESCPGCRIRNKNCTWVKKGCDNLSKGLVKFCYECEKFPCERLKKLDSSYRKKYGMSMVDNLKKIEKIGIKKFVESEEKKWKCPNCDGLICVHTKKCYNCK